MREIVGHVLAMFEARQEFALVRLVGETGSTPRAAGAHMLVRADGSIVDTIGGGLLEITMMREAAGVIRRRRSRLTTMALTGRSMEGPCMVCGGHAQVLISYIDPDDDRLPAVCRAAAEVIRENRRAWLLTAFAAQPGDSKVEYALLQENGEAIGRLPCRAEDLRNIIGRVHVHGTAPLPDGRALHVEPLEPSSVAVICGAGHVAHALAPAASAAGFDVVVLDDRPEFANPERFATASTIVVLESFERALEGFEIGAQTFVIAVTRGHAHDFTVITQALATQAGYIGLMGSATKRTHVLRTLAEQGFSQDDIARIHTPIGLPIGAETPAELAVSIVAELIQVRAATRHAERRA